jgi:hypothetical protein
MKISRKKKPMKNILIRKEEKPIVIEPVPVTAIVLKPKKKSSTLIEKPKPSIEISIDRSKSGAVKIEFGKKKEAIKIDKFKKDNILDVFSVPDEINVCVVTDLKNIPTNEEPVDKQNEEKAVDEKKLSMNFVFKNSRSREISVKIFSKVNGDEIIPEPEKDIELDKEFPRIKFHLFPERNIQDVSLVFSSFFINFWVLRILIIHEIFPFLF